MLYGISEQQRNNQTKQTRGSEQMRDKNLEMTLGGRLKTVRLHIAGKKLSQSEMARYMGVGLRVYQNYERDNANPGADKLANLLRKLYQTAPDRILNANWLLTGVGEPFLSAAPGASTQGPFEASVVIENSTIVNANEGVERLTGYTRDEIIGASTMKFLTPESRRLVEKYVSEDTEAPYTVMIKAKRGPYINAEIRGKTIEHEGKRVRLLEMREAPLSSAVRNEILFLLEELPEHQESIRDILRGKRAVEQLGAGF